MELAPFNFPGPIMLLDERKSPGKFLGLWLLADLPEYDELS